MFTNLCTYLPKETIKTEIENNEKSFYKNNKESQIRK